MKPSLYADDGPRGLYCPCGADMTACYVAQTYPSAAGMYRRRVCRKCHADVETSEIVLGHEIEVLDITGLSADQRNTVHKLVRLLRAK